MAGEPDPPTESQITGDADAIRAWAEAHDHVPVRADDRLDVVPADERPAGADELTWDEFDAALTDEEKLVVRHGDASPALDVVDRSDVLGRATVETEGVAEAVVAGETVETTVTERAVVEHTVVQEATVESEIVDRELLQSDVVDVQLLTTDVDHCTVSRTTRPPETAEAVQRFRPGTRTEEPYEVEVAVDEVWSLTREVLEGITIESRIVETDVEETETVETDTIRETVDVAGVTETVLAGELVASPETASDAVDAGHVETEIREDDVVETRFARRQTIEEELSVRKEISGEISDAEAVDTRAIASTVVESDVVEADEYDLAASDRAGVEAETAEAESAEAETAEAEPAEAKPVETETVDAEPAEAKPGETETVDAEPAEPEPERPTADAAEAATTDVRDRSPTDVADRPATADTDESPTEEPTRERAQTSGVEADADPGEHVTLTEDDTGKAVVDRAGADLGMVVGVEGDRLHVDRNPSLTDRIRTALGWGDGDEDTHSVDRTAVERVDDDQVVVDLDAAERRDSGS